MSYILEGLKKLEQKRRQEARLPGFLSFREEKTPKPRRPILWPYLLFIALLLNAGIILWWISPWRSLGTYNSTLSSRTAKAVTSKPVEFKDQNPFPRKEPPTSKIINEAPQSPGAKKPKEAIPPVEGKSPSPKRSPETVPDSAKSQPSLNSKVVPEGRIVKLNDLPPEIKKSLPALKMSVHYYSPDNQSRFATINDRTLHEGEILSEGLRVAEITPEGTVLNYKGHRFRISVNENP